MSLKGYRALGSAAAVAAVAALLVAALMPGCEACVETAAGGCVPMACHYAFVMVALLELAAAVVLAGLAFVKCKVGRRWLALCGAGMQVLCWAVAFTPLVGLCGSVQMACHGKAWACAVLQVAVVALAVVAAALADPKRAQRPRKEL